MFGSYLKVAFRNLRQYRAYTLINVVGLAVGLTVTLLMLMYAANEMSYESFHEKGDRIFRASVDWGSGHNLMRFPGAMGPLGPAVVERIPDVEQVVRFVRGRGSVEYEDKTFSESVFYADSSVFDLFSFPLIAGNPRTALSAPYSAVITRELAEKYFGSTDAVGKSLTFDGEHSLLVTGIMENIPVNTILHCDFMISLSTMASQQIESLTDWHQSGSYYTFLLLRPGASPEAVLEQMTAIHLENAGDVSASRAKLRLQRFVDLHLKSDTIVHMGPKGNLMHVYLSISVALLVLGIACFNYINLATARSLRRAKEISMRRVLGASRRHLVLQLLGESLLTTFLAILCGLALYEMLISDLSAYLGVVIEQNESISHYPYLISAVLTSVVGLLAGGYPALVLSRQGSTVSSGRVAKPLAAGSTLRKILVVSQFSVSIILIIVTAVVYNQIHFMKTSDLGFEKNDVVLVSFNPDFARSEQRYSVLKDEIEQLPMVTSVAGTGKAPGIRSESQFTVRKPDDPEGESRMMDNIIVDQGYVSTLGLNVVNGQAFAEVDPNLVAESVILNEAAVKHLGYDNPIGQTLILPKKETTVIGVVKDFHLNSFQQVIEPIIFHIEPTRVSLLAVKFQSENSVAAMVSIEEVWRRLMPDEPFRARFLSETYDSLYRSDEKTGEMLIVFAALAILVSCLGLFGLSAFSAERRTSEIGVRKVLGATVTDIVRLLSREYVVLIGIASLIAFPITYYAVSRWLESFAYRVNISWMTFVASSLLTLAIALATVSLQSIKAARTNPVETLRQE